MNMQSRELGCVRKFKLDILFLFALAETKWIFVCLWFLLPICLLLLLFSTLVKAKAKQPPNSMCKSLSGSLLVLAPHQSVNETFLFFPRQKTQTKPLPYYRITRHQEIRLLLCAE